MRIGIGQLWQETNTFNPVPTTRHDFERFGVLRGADLIERMADTNELGGFIQSLRTWPEKPEIVGLVRLPAWPSGACTAETLSWLRDELLTALQRSLPLDGLLLALHGALAADGTPDVEGAILAAAREIIGPAVPLVATLDLHANVTQRMARASDALVLYHTAPHIDVFETGGRGAELLRRILVDEARPVTAFQKIPMVVPAERADTQDPASVSHGLRETLQALEAEQAILTAGLATVQPWLDVPELGTTVIVVTDGDVTFASSTCSSLASSVWNSRREYLPELVPVDDAVRVAHANPVGLVVLSDSADATTSGAVGESTAILSELLRHDWPRPAIVPFVDPGVVADAERAGVGATLAVTLGGKRDRRFSKPIALDVAVEKIFDARFVLSGHLARNLSIDMGRCALLRRGGIHIVVTSESGPHFAPELFMAAGLDPFAAAVLVAKSPCGFRAAYAKRAARILVVRSPGCAPSDFWRYEYSNIRRPLWPWDEMEEWSPSPQIFARSGVGIT
jgi:microcystin degradation protein MlrC